LKKFLLLLATTFVFVTQATFAQTHVNGYYKKDGTYVHSYTRNSKSSTHSTYISPHSYSYTSTSSAAQKDSHGRIKRSSSAKHQFEKKTGYPHGRAGYVVDHVIPLSKGGCDCPDNMQWQTIQDAKEKDKWERK